jgi:hypothetical protein
MNMGSSVYSSPVPANGTLFISNRNQLYALKAGASGGKTTGATKPATEGGTPPAPVTQPPTQPPPAQKPPAAPPATQKPPVSGAAGVGAESPSQAGARP